MSLWSTIGLPMLVSALIVSCHDSTPPARPDTTTVTTFPSRYHVTVLGQATTFVGVDMNDRGQVAGTLRVGSHSVRALRWTSGIVDSLSYGADSTYALGIDNAGNVLGSNQLLPFSRWKTLLWRVGSSVPTDLTPAPAPKLSQPGAAQMSRSGRVFVPPKYLWTASVLDSIPQTISFARINDRGDLFYSEFVPQPYVPSALRFADGRIVELFLPGGREGPNTEVGLNNESSAIGTSEVGSPGPTHAYLYNPAKGITDLSTIYGPTLGVSAINDRGVIVGTLNGQPILLAAGRTVQLNPMLDSAGYSIVSAKVINNAAQILAVARDPQGSLQTVVLTPATP